MPYNLYVSWVNLLQKQYVSCWQNNLKHVLDCPYPLYLWNMTYISDSWRFRGREFETYISAEYFSFTTCICNALLFIFYNFITELNFSAAITSNYNDWDLCVCLLYYWYKQGPIFTSTCTRKKVIDQNLQSLFKWCCNIAKLRNKKLGSYLDLKLLDKPYPRNTFWSTLNFIYSIWQTYFNAKTFYTVSLRRFLELEMISIETLAVVLVFISWTAFGEGT